MGVADGLRERVVSRVNSKSKSLSDSRSLTVSDQGYSHGALITSLHPVLPPPVITSHILLSYPLGPRGLLTCFRTQTYAKTLKELLRNPLANVLVLYGTEDEFTSETSYDAWAQGLMKDSGGSCQLKVEKMQGGTHFWRGNAARLMGRAIEEWLP